MDLNEAIPGPDLPWNFNLHCVAKMNTTHYILIGGEDNPKHTLIVSFPDLTRNKMFMTIGPELRGNGRYGHACAHIRHRNGSNYVIAVGGVTGGKKPSEGLLDTMEILNGDDVSNGWSEGETNQLSNVDHLSFTIQVLMAISHSKQLGRQWLNQQKNVY